MNLDQLMKIAIEGMELTDVNYFKEILDIFKSIEL